MKMHNPNIPAEAFIGKSAAYYPGVYTYDDTSWFAHPWFPKFNAAYWDECQKIVNLFEWEGKTGQPATKVARPPP
jgi:hypothetical protein